jgi:diguanylate cyclase (GGDEF)-like protein
MVWAMGIDTSEKILGNAARLDAVAWMTEASSDGESFDRVTRVLAHLLDCPFALFSMIRSDGQLIRSAFGMDAGERPVPEGAFCRHAVVTGVLLTVLDASQDERFRDAALVVGPPHIRFYAGMPVRAPNGMIVGTLCVIDTAPREFTPDIESVLEDLCACLEELLLLRTLSVTDKLTGLYNRAFYDDLLEREWSSARRDSDELSLVLVDVDHFKAYNDSMGHQAGDACLKAVAAALSGQFRRPGDVVSRYGGEEFIVLLPRTSAVEAQRLADQAAQAVSQMQITHPGAPRGHVTISAGVASHTPIFGDGPEQLLARADTALYSAKASGRNTVCAADRSTQLP